MSQTQNRLGSSGEDIRPMLVAYQSEAADAIERHFTKQSAPQVPMSREQLLAAAVIEATAALAEKDQQLVLKDARIGVLEPKARTFDVFLGSGGDIPVGEAAKVLCRDHGINIGERRLFVFMEQRNPSPRQSRQSSTTILSQRRRQLGQSLATVLRPLRGSIQTRGTTGSTSSARCSISVVTSASSSGMPRMLRSAEWCWRAILPPVD